MPRTDLDIRTKEGKAKLVTSLCNSIRDEIVEKIKSGKVPDHWDGHNLRWLLHTKFWHETTTRMRDGRMVQRISHDSEVYERML